METELRQLLEIADSAQPSGVEGHWRIRASMEGRTWIVIVEPEADTRRLVVITVYAVD